MNRTELVKFKVNPEQKERLKYWQGRSGYPTLASYIRAAALRAGPLLAGELVVNELAPSSRHRLE